MNVFGRNFLEQVSTRTEDKQIKRWWSEGVILYFDPTTVQDSSYQGSG